MPAWANLPNLLTLLRLVLTPVVVALIVDGRYLAAGCVFGVAAFTDVLDGAVARRLAVGTQVGAYLDPVADKCLLSGVFLALAWANLMPWWVVAIIFGRDIYILAGVAIFLFFTPVRGFPPSVWGKVSTFVQICTVAVWMSRVVFGTHVLAEISAAMLWPCVGFTVWSGLDYTWKAVHLFKEILTRPARGSTLKSRECL